MCMWSVAQCVLSGYLSLPQPPLHPSTQAVIDASDDVSPRLRLREDTSRC